MGWSGSSHSLTRLFPKVPQSPFLPPLPLRLLPSCPATVGRSLSLGLGSRRSFRFWAVRARSPPVPFYDLPAPGYPPSSGTGAWVTRGPRRRTGLLVGARATENQSWPADPPRHPAVRVLRDPARRRQRRWRGWRSPSSTAFRLAA